MKCVIVLFIFVIVLVYFVIHVKILQRPKYFDAAEEALLQGNAHQQTFMLVGVLCKC